MPGPLRLTRRSALVALILVGALAIRVAEVQRTTYRPINDAGFYLNLASQIAHSGDYSTHTRGAGGTEGPSAYFPPGFPYLLAGVHAISPSLKAARISQAVIGTVTVALVGLVALELFGEAVALIALVIAALYPVFIELSGVLVAENLLVALELAALWAVLRARRAQRPYWWAAAAGVLIGLAALTHENGLVLLVLVAGLLKRPKAAALLVGAAVLTIVPWTIRNAVVMHRFIPITDENGITLIGTYNPMSAADAQLPWGWRLYLAGEPTRQLTEPELNDRLTSKALHYIGQHPLAPLKVGYHNALRMFELEGSYPWKVSAASIDIPQGTARIGVYSFWLLCLMALVGAFTRTARAAPKWLWLVPVVFALSIVFVNVETPRFRAPIDPFLILLAACGVAALGRRAATVAAGRLGRAPVGRESGAMDPPRGAQTVEVVQGLA